MQEESTYVDGVQIETKVLLETELEAWMSHSEFESGFYILWDTEI